ncbi:MAG: hypothetical protein WC849_03215 [Candidatus Paceibacterota bacterium]
MENLLEKELNYYKKHQKELVNKYSGRFLVIKDEKLQGDYETEIEAYNTGKKNNELGTFLIQKCLPGEESYTQTFHSRVVFS